MRAEARDLLQAVENFHSPFGGVEVAAIGSASAVIIKFLTKMFLDHIFAGNHVVMRAGLDFYYTDTEVSLNFTFC